MSWMRVSRFLPVTFDREFCEPRSKTVVVFMSWGDQKMARLVRDDGEDPFSRSRWISACSEGWDLTESVTHWRPCYDDPTAEEPRDAVPGFVVESRQIDMLKSIARKLHGDGSHLTTDGRRDLANQLSLLLGQLQEQSVEF